MFNQVVKKYHQLGVYKSLKLAYSYLRSVRYFFQIDSRSLFELKGKLIVLKSHGQILLSPRVKIYPGARLSCYGTKDHPAQIHIGEGSSLGDRTEIHAGERVIIGKRVLISWDCIIMDRDYHGYNGQAERVKSIVIDDDVIIGCRCLILKGVHVARGAVIGAGSVVTKDVAAFVMVAGNPARVIRKLTPEPADDLNFITQKPIHVEDSSLLSS